MHISDEYEHEPILSYQPENGCPPSGCTKVGTQCVDVAAPLMLTPVAVAGTATITCQGVPSVDCVTEAGGTSCTVTVTQRICVSVPIRYSVTVVPSDPAISCAADTGNGCRC